MSDPRLKIVRPTTDAEKATRTAPETIEVTVAVIETWKKPPFQRPFKNNDRVAEVSAEIMKTEIIPGVIHFGVLVEDGVRVLYLVDGQHRIEAFKMSKVEMAYTDAVFHHCETMAAMADLFVKLNGKISNMLPDDILRGLELSTPALARLRKACFYVGYANVRRGDRSPVLSAAATLRCWAGSATEVPNVGGRSARELAEGLSMEEAESLIGFLGCAFDAWKRDESNYRLWGNLNLCICMWLYRRTVMSTYSARTPRLTKEQFTRCLMSLSSSQQYPDWLLGRQMTSKDLAPAYSRVKQIFVERVGVDTGTRPPMPAPSWSTHQGGRGR